MNIDIPVQFVCDILKYECWYVFVIEICVFDEFIYCDYCLVITALAGALCLAVYSVSARFLHPPVMCSSVSFCFNMFLLWRMSRRL